MANPIQQILELYFNQDKPIEITLMNGTVLAGKLVSFFHDGDDQIASWHFVDQDDLEKYEELKALDGGSQYGRIILQKDIKSIRFK